MPRGFPPPANFKARLPTLKARPSISQHNSEDSRELQQTLATAADAADRSHTLHNHHSEVSELSSYRARSQSLCCTTL